MNYKLIFLLTASLLLNTTTLYAEDAVTSVVREGVRGAFDELERQIIKKYFSEYQITDKQAGKQKKKKNNKGKSKQLPPGIVKKLERGGTLPPGIAKRDLPYELKEKLPKAPEGYEHIIVGNDVMSVDIDTGEIADIITDAILGK